MLNRAQLALDMYSGGSAGSTAAAAEGSRPDALVAPLGGRVLERDFLLSSAKLVRLVSRRPHFNNSRVFSRRFVGVSDDLIEADIQYSVEADGNKRAYVGVNSRVLGGDDKDDDDDDDDDDAGDENGYDEGGDIQDDGEDDDEVREEECADLDM